MRSYRSNSVENPTQGGFYCGISVVLASTLCRLQWISVVEATQRVQTHCQRLSGSKNKKNLHSLLLLTLEFSSSPHDMNCCTQHIP